MFEASAAAVALGDGSDAVGAGVCADDGDAGAVAEGDDGSGAQPARLRATSAMPAATTRALARTIPPGVWPRFYPRAPSCHSERVPGSSVTIPSTPRAVTASHCASVF